MRLKDKYVFITGAAQGIGREIALMMAQDGAHTAIADINEEKAQLVKEEVEKLGQKAWAFKLNVSESTEVSSVLKTFIEESGRIDVLVNNAGITRDNLILRMKDEDWDSVLSINLKSAFLCSRESLKYMTKQRSGVIVNISSVVAFIGNAGQANYSASKAGLMGLTKTLAREYASRGIRVNAVAPGYIETPMTDKLSQKVKDSLLQSIPLNRLGTPEDVAKAVVFLSCEDSHYITGQVIHVNGGMYV